jgi:nitrogen regulatory protein PII
MKLISAVIRPDKIEHVCDALEHLGVAGLTVSEVRGYGRKRTSLYGVSNDALRSLARLKLEVAVPDEIAKRASEAIIAAAQTGRPGDGKIFVLDLAEIVRIRTRETGIEAL